MKMLLFCFFQLKFNIENSLFAECVQQHWAGSSYLADKLQKKRHAIEMNEISSLSDVYDNFIFKFFPLICTDVCNIPDFV